MNSQEIKFGQPALKHASPSDAEQAWHDWVVDYLAARGRTRPRWALEPLLTFDRVVTRQSATPPPVLLRPFDPPASAFIRPPSPPPPPAASLQSFSHPVAQFFFAHWIRPLPRQAQLPCNISPVQHRSPMSSTRPHPPPPRPCPSSPIIDLSEDDEPLRPAFALVRRASILARHLLCRVHCRRPQIRDRPHPTPLAITHIAFARSNADGWCDGPGFNAYFLFLRAAFPATAAEVEEDWDNRVRLTAQGRPASHRGDICGSQTQRIAAEAVVFMQKQVGLRVDVGVTDDNAEQVVLSSDMAEGDPRLPMPAKILITYISRQSAGNHKLTPESHEGLVQALQALVKAEDVNSLESHPVIVIPIGAGYKDYALQVSERLKALGLFVDVDNSADTLPKKVRNAEIAQYNFILLSGTRK
ncbi:hypothetical protein B0H14DRAFT_3733799 [Mycena olivaceomarginata]|nr:hypothetical protein B0H14DRAFT_3733799 [Mycena olivaceomarginata]